MSTAIQRANTILQHVSPLRCSSSSSFSSPSSSVVISVHSGGVAEFTLNRPSSYNALTTDMVSVMLSALIAYQSDLRVACVLITARGKAFCAGGDILGLASGATAGFPPYHPASPSSFLITEYTLDYLTNISSKPCISVLHALAMGGGCGLSLHNEYVICCDETVVSMPECGIGLIPDVGSTHWLSRLPGGVGMFCALTGYRLTAADCMYLGLATHYIPTEVLPTFIQALRQHTFQHNTEAPSIRHQLDALIAEYAAPTGALMQSYLEEKRDVIDKAFQAESIQHIRENLHSMAELIHSADQRLREGGEWAKQQLQILNTKSPTSLQVQLIIRQ